MEEEEEEEEEAGVFVLRKMIFGTDWTPLVTRQPL